MSQFWPSRNVFKPECPQSDTTAGESAQRPERQTGERLDRSGALIQSAKLVDKRCGGRDTETPLQDSGGDVRRNPNRNIPSELHMRERSPGEKPAIANGTKGNPGPDMATLAAFADDDESRRRL